MHRILQPAMVVVLSPSSGLLLRLVTLVGDWAGGSLVIYCPLRCSLYAGCAVRAGTVTVRLDSRVPPFGYSLRLFSPCHTALRSRVVGLGVAEGLIGSLGVLGVEH